jgi:hypothetical protein
MEGYDVVTSDDCKYGQVVGVQDGHLIVEHGTLRKSRHAIPETFATADEAEHVVHLTVSKEIVDASPKIGNGTLDRQAIAEHYGLAEATAAPETEGYGDVLPDDPAQSAETDEGRSAPRHPHPTSPALRSGSATFSLKGRREGFVWTDIPPTH